MNFKKNNELPHEILFNQTNYILKHNYIDYISINNNSAYRIKLNLNKYGKKNILGCKNLILILDLVSDDIINNSILKSLISTIKFQINGHDVEALSENNFIWMMINYYGLEIKQIGSKIYFPIPLNLFQNGFVPCYFDHLCLLLQMNTQNQIYNKISISLEIFYGELNFNKKYLIDYKNNYLDKLIHSINNFNGIINNFQNGNSLDKIKKIIKSNNLILFGYEYSELIELCESVTKSYIWINISRNSNKLLELFFFLTNKQTGQIITDKFFKKLEFRKNSSPNYSVSYEELIYDLCTSHKKLPKGVYRIPFENIYSNGLIFDNSNEYTVCIEANNDINIDNYNVQFYGLYNYTMNFITDDINKECSVNFTSNNKIITRIY